MLHKILFLVAIFIVAKAQEYYGTGTGSVIGLFRSNGSLTFKEHSKLNIADQARTLNEEITVGTTILRNLRIIEIDLNKAIGNSLAFKYNIKSSDGKDVGLYYAEPYYVALDSDKPYKLNPVSQPICDYNRCEIGFVYSDDKVKGNDVLTATTPLKYAFYVTLKNGGEGNVVVYKAPYNDYWYPFTYLPGSKWVANQSFVSNIVPEYVNKTGILPREAKTPDFNLFFGPFWPLTTGQKLFTAATLDQKGSGELTWDYELTKDEKLIPKFGKEIDETLKDIDICIDDKNGNINNLDKTKYHKYIHVPAELNNGKSIMEKMTDNSSLLYNSAILYYRNNNATFNGWGVNVPQSHYYPECVRKVKNNLPGILNFTMNGTLEIQNKTINDVPYKVVQVPKDVLEKGFNFTCNLTTISDNPKFANYFNQSFETFLVKLKRAQDNFTNYPDNHIKDTLEFKNKINDLGYYTCGSKEIEGAMKLPVNTTNNGRVLFIPKDGEEIEIKEVYNNKASARIQCDQYSSIGVLDTMEITEPSSDENKATEYCEKDSKNDFTYDGVKVTAALTVQNNTAVTCNYTTAIGTSFIVKKTITLKK
uniref:T9SS type A sorting domain-containing protein n=1 Tax=Parastrongyloides trichosuri TaxID=131310 RepID=A0A0N4ZDR5_PARTI